MTGAATLGGVPIGEFVLVHAAGLEGAGLSELGALALGVGKVAAVATLYSYLPILEQRRHVRAVLLFGVAGAYPPRHRSQRPPLAIGDVCIVGSDRLGDEGVETPNGFRTLNELGLGDAGPFPANPKMAAEAAERLGVPVVRGVTVSTCSGTETASQRLAARSGADVETMEGAAVAYVCRQRELPLLQVRAISNWTGDRDRGEWDLGAAVDAVQRAVRRLTGPVP